jgi:hypothetical protein
MIGTDQYDALPHKRSWCEPVALPKEWLDKVAGGLNPQPLPPRWEARASAL